MLLYLLRHADADTVASSDSERALSEKGHAQAGKVARFCVKHEVRPEVVLTSPLRRALQTAAPVAEALGVQCTVEPWLASGMTPDEALEGLREYAKCETVMLVGHEPDFSRLAAHAIGGGGTVHLNVRKASLTLLDFQSLRAGAAALEFSIPCRFT